MRHILKSFILQNLGWAKMATAEKEKTLLRASEGKLPIDRNSPVRFASRDLNIGCVSPKFQVVFRCKSARLNELTSFLSRKCSH